MNLCNCDLVFGGETTGDGAEDVLLPLEVAGEVGRGGGEGGGQGVLGVYGGCSLVLRIHQLSSDQLVGGEGGGPLTVGGQEGEVRQRGGRGEVGRLLGPTSLLA